MADAETLLEQWLAAEVERNPVLGTYLGLEGFDGQLGDFSAARWETQPATDRHTAGELAAFQGADLPIEQRIDVALVLSHLAGRAALEDWAAWRRNPSVYVDPCLSGVFSLFLYRLRPEPELVAAAIERLAAVPGVLAAGRHNLDPDVAPPLLVERAIGACRAGVVWVREGLPSEVTDEALRSDLADAAARAADAMDEFARFLDGLQQAARGDWALGEERYSRLLLEREVLGYGAAEMHGRGKRAWDALDAEMSDLAARIDPAATSWRDVTLTLGQDHAGTVEGMKREYEESCHAARQFLIDRQLVTLPEGEECAIVASPPFQRPILAVASYQAAPPFSASRVGHLFVPYPADGATPLEVEQRLEDNNTASIPTIAVHEAYPGHHWQLTWAGSCPRRVRHVVRTPYFTEGWALYAEHMMREEGFFADPRQELSHLDARIFRAARIVVDTALHSGEMSQEEAVSYITTRASLTESVARAEVSRYCAWPTQAASYLTGSLEIERLRDRWFAEQRGSLRQFHDAVAASPGLPVALAEVEVFGVGPGGTSPAPEEGGRARR